MTQDTNYILTSSLNYMGVALLNNIFLLQKAKIFPQWEPGMG